MDTEHRRMRQPKESDGPIFLADALYGRGGSSGAILRQEATGQVECVNSTQLPIKGCADDVLEAMGIKLGEATCALFRDAILPPGWAKRATDHSMWSEVVDDTGEVRLNIFYKAAFYDRSATIHVKE